MAGFRAYIEETVQELTQKVSWPTWEELQSSAIIVLLTSAIIALIVWLMDFTLGVNNSAVWKGVLGFFYEMVSK